MLFEYPSKLKFIIYNYTEYLEQEKLTEAGCECIR